MPDEEVCSGLTGHTECVQVMYDPAEVTYERLCELFWDRLGDNRFLPPKHLARTRASPRCAPRWTPRASAPPTFRRTAAS